MVFSSISFLFLFFPIQLAVYYLTYFCSTINGHRTAWIRPGNLVILVFSFIFYFWGENYRLWILLATTLIDYCCGLLIAGAFIGGEVKIVELGKPRTNTQKAFLYLSLTSNLAMLGFFKYFNFGVDLYNTSVPGNWQYRLIHPVVLPLGISFYTFQSMSYTIDVYRGDVRATRNLVDYLCCVTMFPHMVAGPIVRYRNLARQARRRTLTMQKFSDGARTFILGLSKKVLIANVMAKVADHVFMVDVPRMNAPIAWTGITAYSLQIYFDFSGYSDMAIGLGRMLGFELPKNFNFPYISESIRDFWRRWHITLSSWFRDYLYIPLGGNRTGALRSYMNLIIVFFLCGLWHGASVNFVVWGLFHGIFLVLERTKIGSALEKLPRPFRHAYTLLVVMVGWVFFRAENMTQAAGILKTMAGLGTGDPAFQHLGDFITPQILLVFIIGAIACTPAIPALRTENTVNDNLHPGYLPMVRTALINSAYAALYVTSGCYLAAGSYNPFIYFRF